MMIRSLTGLRRDRVAREVTAGITLLALAVPLNIGYAQIAGLPPTAGLYALVLPMVVYALLVSSRQLVASPDAATAALVASSIGGLAVAGSDDYLTLALAQAILSGVMFLVLAVCKLGFLASFLSKPILVGFVSGLAVDIMVSQVAKMLGVELAGHAFVDKLVALLTGLPSAHGWSVVIAAIALTVLVVGRRLVWAAPWALVALVVTTVTTMALDLGDAGVAVLGAIPTGPPTIRWPHVTWATWVALVPAALALTLVTTAEGLLVARSYAEKHGDPDDPDRDLLALGASNVVAGLSGGFAIGGSVSRTAAMDEAGARTQLPVLVAAAGTLLVLLFGTALLEPIPEPAVGAVVAVAVVRLIGVGELARVWRLDRFELSVGGASFLGTLLFGPLVGIAIAFVLSLVNLAKRASDPAVEAVGADGEARGTLTPQAHAGMVAAPGLLIVRIAAPVFFANGAVVTGAVKRAVEELDVDHLVLDMESVTDVDVTGAEALEGLREWLERQGVDLAFSRVHPPIRSRLDHLGLLGAAATYTTNRDAIAALGRDGQARPGGTRD